MSVFPPYACGWSQNSGGPSADVKYAVERTFDRGLFPLGPSYYPLLLAGNAKTYPGPTRTGRRTNSG
jgi:hypothetical protein